MGKLRTANLRRKRRERREQGGIVDAFLKVDPAEQDAAVAELRKMDTREAMFFYGVAVLPERAVVKGDFLRRLPPISP